MIIVDTSVWVDFLRGADQDLQPHLSRQEVICHPMVIGELACGTLPKRTFALRRLRNLPTAKVVDHKTLLDFIESWSLHGRGIGYVDAHLLASSRLGEARWLWTRDKRLNGLAGELGVAFDRGRARPLVR